ncbi:hypothetical protein ACULN0_10795 [Pectobacterium actinidiae]|uniref:hypothetical protein n=1 Tax=Pectobacterium actinidiae TaxID=1507808 RepID=UPI004040C03A
MPIFRESGGSFSPVKRLDINDAGTIKRVAAAWINDGGTFKKIFPSYTEQDASLGYDTDNASVTWQSYTSGYYNNTGGAAQYTYIPLKPESATESDIVYCRISLITDSGEEIPFTSSFTASAGTVYNYYEYNNGSYVGPSNSVRLTVENLSTVGYSLHSNIAIALNKNVVDYSAHIGKTVYVKWMWRERGSNTMWTYTFPHGQLIDYTL